MTTTSETKLERILDDEIRFHWRAMHKERRARDAEYGSALRREIEGDFARITRTVLQELLYIRHEARRKGWSLYD